MKKVLVLDANQRSALAVTRSLGKQGIEVFTAEETSTALASASKFSTKHFTYPSPRQNHQQFIEMLSQLVEQNNIDILLPMTELTTMLLLKHKDLFANASIPFPDIDTVDSLANKCLLMQTATSLNIPIPRTWYADSPANLPCELDELPYPIVLKPGKSWLLYQGQWRRAEVQFAADADQAKTILDSDWAFKSHPFMLQECVDGHGAGVFSIYDKGRSLALFAHRRLREKPPNGGVSVLSESVRVPTDLGAYSQALLDNANWHGVAMVEFKIATDGTPYLMEINTRFWGTLQLAIDSGVDFPHLLFQLACDEQPAQVVDYKKGNKLRWLMGDLDSLYLSLKDSQTSFSTKAKLVGKFLTPSLSTRHEINRLSDIKPFWFELRQYFRDILGLNSNS